MTELLYFGTVKGQVKGFTNCPSPIRNNPSHILLIRLNVVEMLMQIGIDANAACSCSIVETLGWPSKRPVVVPAWLDQKEHQNE